ncbi:MAG TPA: hypothetical protein VID70_07620 [Solirubrobacteraceae bacterium]
MAGDLALGAFAVEAELPGAVPPAVVGLTLWVEVECAEVVVVGEVIVDVTGGLAALVEGATLDVVVSEEEETPADWVVVEPPQPARRAVAAMAPSAAGIAAVSFEASRFVSIGGSAYPKGRSGATPRRRRF